MESDLSLPGDCLITGKTDDGETFSRSDIFDNFRYIGVNLATDDNMLPPNLRGYAPEVTGVAKTNAKITVSQQGRVIYETLVAPGPFRIQDINDAVSGKLDVGWRSRMALYSHFRWIPPAFLT